MLKILHLADLHLDSPMHRLPLDKAKKFKNRLRKTFESAVSFAHEQGCVAVLLAGDLFDSEFYSPSTLDAMTEIFRANPQISFFISAGNHDPLTPDSPYERSNFPENVYIFKSNEVSSFEFPELDLTVYGYSFTSQSYLSRPLSSFSAKSGGFNVLCAHSELDSPLSPYAPISLSELEHSGLDYAALGHIHTKPEITVTGKTTFAYSGCIAGRDFSEQGEKGGILVTLDRQLGENTVKAERVTFCHWVYDELCVDITSKTEAELSDLIRTETEKHIRSNAERELILRVILKGVSRFTPDCAELVEALSDIGVASVKSEITLLPPDGLELDYTVKGELYRRLKPLLESPAPEEREKAALALSYGLAALEGTL